MKYNTFQVKRREVSVNERKAAAFRRKQQREAQALPLFSEQIREQQHSWDTELERRQAQDDLTVGRMRSFEAQMWRKARAMYFALPLELRGPCKAEWEAWRGPHNPFNLIYVVQKHNGVGAAREEKMAAERRASNARIVAMVSAQPCLV